MEKSEIFIKISTYNFRPKFAWEPHASRNIIPEQNPISFLKTEAFTWNIVLLIAFQGSIFV